MTTVYTYEINVAHHGKHQSVITVDRNGPDSPAETHVLLVFSAMCQAFPASQGYTISLTKIETAAPKRFCY